jgi:hypothetical protein
MEDWGSDEGGLFCQDRITNEERPSFVMRHYIMFNACADFKTIQSFAA